MLNLIKSFTFFETFKNISVYFSAQVAIQALGIISLPVYTYFLSTEEYGIVNIYISYAMVFSILAGGNMWGAVSRYYYEERNDFDTFLGTSIIVTCISFAIGAVLVLIFQDEIARFINLPKKTIPYLMYYCFLTIIALIYNQLFIPQKRAKLVSSTQVIVHYLKFAIVVVLFYLMSKDIYMCKIRGELVAMTLVSAFMVYKIYPFVKLKYSSVHFKYILSYCLPLIPFVLSGYILHSFDQMYINAALGNGAAGLYSFAYKIGFLLAGFIGALLSGSNPDYYRWMNEKAFDKVNIQIISLTKLLVVATAFLLLFTEDLGKLLASKEEYHEALSLIPVIVGGYFVYGITQFYFRGIYYIKKNIYLVYIVLMAGIVNVVLNYYYIPIYGYVAAAYTTLVSYLVMLLVTIGYVKYIFELPKMPRRMFRISSLLLPLILLSSLNKFYEVAWLLELILNGITIIAIIMAIYYRETFGMLKKKFG